MDAVTVDNRQLCCRSMGAMTGDTDGTILASVIRVTETFAVDTLAVIAAVQRTNTDSARNAGGVGQANAVTADA